MTARDLFYQKYLDFMKNVNIKTWQCIEESAKLQKVHPAWVVFSKYIVVTENDIKANGGWNGELFKDLDQLHKDKLLASNKHRQYRCRVWCYWLTKKGFKQLGF